MNYSPIKTDQLAEDATDGYPALVHRYKQYLLSYNALISQGTAPQMLNSGFMWKYAKWLYVISLTPFSLVIIYVVFQNSSLGLSFSDWFINFKANNPSVVKPIAALVALLGMGAIVYIVWKPFNKLGVWGGNNNKPENYDEVEDTKELAFFTQKMHTESGYNAIFVYVILVLLGLIGLVLTLVKLTWGLSVLAIVSLLALLWVRYQKNARPFFEVYRSGSIKIKYKGGKINEFNVADCKQIEMLYADSAYYSRWYDRPFIREMYKATGASSLFPFKIVFSGNNNVSIPLELENVSTANKTYINPIEAEFYFAGLLKEHGFTFINNQTTDGMLTNTIEGWVAVKNN